MKAIFATRCGCQQAYEIPYPPPPEIVLPLHPKRKWGVNWLDPDVAMFPPATPTDPVETRRFVLDCTLGSRQPSGEAYYAED